MVEWKRNPQGKIYLLKIYYLNFKIIIDRDCGSVYKLPLLIIA